MRLIVMKITLLIMVYGVFEFPWEPHPGTTLEIILVTIPQKPFYQPL